MSSIFIEVNALTLISDPGLCANDQILFPNTNGQLADREAAPLTDNKSYVVQ